MMSSYFRYSQRIRKEIDKDTAMLERIKARMRNPQEDTEDFLSAGGNNCVWMMGRTASGLDVALRRKKHGDFRDRRESSEAYGLVAERFAQQGRRVPLFTVGVYHPLGEYAILVEDLSRGKTKTISNFTKEDVIGQDESGFPLWWQRWDLQGIGLVYLDLDENHFSLFPPSHPASKGKFRFMDKKNLLFL